ncbi:MAG: histidinol-phosphate transaminase [Bacteroidota bacterium]
MPNPLFKPYIGKSISYLGGKSLDEIQTKADKIYKLSSNENPIGASPAAIEAIKGELSGLHLYPDRTDKKLCAALADFYDQELSAEHFFAANSGSESLEYIIRAFMGEDMECIVSTPGFSLYENLVKWVGGKPIVVPLIGENFELDVDGILDSITPKTRLIFLTSPNNPTGSYIKKAELAYLLDRIPEHVVVVYDEVYYLFTDAPDYSTAMPFVKAGKQVIGLNSFSKSFGLAGLRLGYFYTTPGLVSYIRGMTRPFLLNSLSLNAGIAALQDDAFIKEAVAVTVKGREYISRELTDIGIQHWPSQGNFVLVKPPMPTDEFEALMLEQGIMVRPVGNFGAEGCVRITVGIPEANEAFVQAVKAVCAVNV